MSSPVPVSPLGPCGPVSPISPLGPCGPVSPVSPLGPCGPVSPVSPLGPWGPVSPVSPFSPWMPCSPCGPVAPCGPRMFAGDGFSSPPLFVQDSTPSALTLGRKYGPASPLGPCGPVAPVSPFSPCGPVAPCGPAGPCGPCSPVAPCSPCGPRMLAGSGFSSPPLFVQDSTPSALTLGRKYGPSGPSAAGSRNKKSMLSASWVTSASGSLPSGSPSTATVTSFHFGISTASAAASSRLLTTFSRSGSECHTSVPPARTRTSARSSPAYTSAPSGTLHSPVSSPSAPSVSASASSPAAPRGPSQPTDTAAPSASNASSRSAGIVNFTRSAPRSSESPASAYGGSGCRPTILTPIIPLPPDSLR